MYYGAMTISPNPSSYLPLTEVEFEIMLAMALKPIHGYGVMKDVEQRTQGRLKLRAGSLYRALHRLQKKRLVEDVPLKQGEDQRRRRYALTPLGREVAHAEAERMERALETARACLKPEGSR